MSSRGTRAGVFASTDGEMWWKRGGQPAGEGHVKKGVVTTGRLDSEQ